MVCGCVESSYCCFLDYCVLVVCMLLDCVCVDGRVCVYGGYGKWCVIWMVMCY